MEKPAASGAANPKTPDAGVAAAAPDGGARTPGQRASAPGRSSNSESPEAADELFPRKPLSSTGEVVLERTPQGFIGETRVELPVGDRLCAVSFPVEVVLCSETELRLRVTPSRALDGTCQLAPLPSAPLVEHLLRRPSLPDAGRQPQIVW
jgi:hypothetical protein